MKRTAKALVVAVLGWQVRRLRRKSRVRVVAVVGSIGKTSTKLAVAKVLAQQFRVRWQDGNYNDIVSVPLIFFGQDMPSLLNPLAWLKVFIANELQIWRPYPYDLVVTELGTDGPGQIAAFSRYLSVDLALVTAIAPEHMEFFDGLDAVAEEEMSIQAFSKVMLVNSDLCDRKYINTANKALFTYGTDAADYRLEIERAGADGQAFTIWQQDKTLVRTDNPAVSKMQLYSICAAAAAGHRFNLQPDRIKLGIEKIEPVNGRMRQLRGVNDAMIIDDTYNSSPEAAKAALMTLYDLPSPQRIAILGNMNELGDFSQAAHAEVGGYCDPRQIDLVVTIGPDANRYLAEAAEKRGCTVKRCDNPVDAGLFVKDQLKPKTIVLAKGSQNGVFAEEAVKQILANSKDIKHLVRQSPSWLKRKRRQFTGITAGRQ